MRSLSTLTPKETIDLGNLAFRVHKKNHPLGGDLYQSKKWKLHFFEGKNGKLQSIAIVDEQKQLMHIDDLWPMNDDGSVSPSSHWLWIDIDVNLVITQHHNWSTGKRIVPNSQYIMFNWLENHGFMGGEFVESLNQKG